MSTGIAQAQTMEAVAAVKAPVGVRGEGFPKVPADRMDTAELQRRASRVRQAALVTVVAFAVMVLVSLTWALPSLMAQTVSDRALNGVAIGGTHGMSSFRVGLSFPVNYDWQFPTKQGDSFLIKLSAADAAAKSMSAQIEMESVIPPSSEEVPLSGITYDGSSEGGPFLVLKFDRPVTLDTALGSDQKSVVVVVSQPQQAESRQVEVAPPASAQAEEPALQQP